MLARQIQTLFLGVTMLSFAVRALPQENKLVIHANQSKTTISKSQDLPAALVEARVGRTQAAKPNNAL